MLGTIPYGDVKSVYDSASVLLFPSLRESFGAPFIEALGRGLPAVALDHQGIADADVGRAAVKVAVRRSAEAAWPPCFGHGNGPVRRRVAIAQPAGIKWASDWVWPVKAAKAVRFTRR